MQRYPSGPKHDQPLSPSKRISLSLSLSLSLSHTHTHTHTHTRTHTHVENVENMRKLPSAGFARLFNQHLCNRSTLFASIFSSLWCNHVGSLFTAEEQKKRLAHDVTDTCATHAGLVHDVTDTDSPHGSVYASFKRVFFNQQSTGKTAVRVFFKYFYSILSNGTRDGSTFGVSFEYGLHFFPSHLFPSQFYSLLNISSMNPQWRWSPSVVCVVLTTVYSLTIIIMTINFSF